MTDKDLERSDATPTNGQPLDPGRRRLAKFGVAGPVVLATLAARPVLAGTECTMSGMTSGNASHPGAAPCSGCTVAFWKAQGNQSGTTFGSTGVSKSATFNSVFGVTAYEGCTPTNDPTDDYTLLQMVNSSVTKSCSPEVVGDPFLAGLGAEAVAAYLNASASGVNFGYEPGDVKNLFVAKYLNDPAGIKAFFFELNNRGCPL